METASHKKITELALRQYDIKDLEKVVKGSELPDIDESQNAYVHHFYNPVTNTNYSNGEDSAKSRCIAHLGKYILTENLEELGRSIHFLEDICTPVHVQYEDTTDTIIRGSLHITFEKELENFCKKVITTYNENEEENEYLDEYLNVLISNSKDKNMSMEEFINICALESSRNYYMYRKSNERVIKDVAINSTFGLSLFAVRYLYSEINKGIEYVKILKNRSEKDVGIMICRKFRDDHKIIDLAPLNNNVRLRCSNNQIYIFERTSSIKNFVLDDIKDIF